MEKGSNKLFGPPGSGKTSRLIRIISESGVPLKKIAYCTFGRHALEDMIKRMNQKGIQDSDMPYFKTLHSMNFSLLGIRKEQVANEKKLKDFCKEKGYVMSICKKDILKDDPYSLLNSFDKEDTLDDKFYKQMQKDRSDRRPFDYIHPRFQTMAGLYMRFKHNYMDWLHENDYIDFIGMIEEGIKRNVCPNVELLCVDEWQDLNTIQIEQVQMWMTQIPTSFHAGDDDQCLVSGTKIQTENGEKNIEHIQIGEKVLGVNGSNTKGYYPVVNKKKTLKQNTLYTIKTIDGQEITTTEEHQFFVGLDNKITHSVYLMYSNKYGYRIGYTKNPLTRMNLERGADCIWILETHANANEARYRELVLSIKYSIPTIVFCARNKHDVLPNQYLEKLFLEIPTEHNTHILAKDMNIDLKSPVFIKKGVNRGGSKRLIVNISMERSTPTKTVWILTTETDDTEKINLLKKLNLTITKGRKNGYRVRTTGDYKTILEIAKAIKSTIDNVFIRENVRKNRHTFIKTPACNVKAGMIIPTDTGYTKVAEVTTKRSKQYTYDIEVDTIHNYFANGICVHNCIYEFAGSDPYAFLNLKCDNETVLQETFRLPKDVLSLSLEVINRNKNRKIKDVHTNKDEGGIYLKTLENACKMLQTLPREESVVFLVRNNFIVNQLWSDLADQGVPIGGYVKERSAVKLMQRGYAEDSFKYEEMDALLSPIFPTVRYFKHGSKMRIKKSLVNMPEQGYTRENLSTMGLTQNFFDDLLSKNCAHLNIQENKLLYINRLFEKYGYNPKPVQITTIHKFKGMEADTIVLVPDITKACADNEMAHAFNIDAVESERRNWYVAITRAAKRLIILDDTDYSNYKTKELNSIRVFLRNKKSAQA